MRLSTLALGRLLLSIPLTAAMAQTAALVVQAGVTAEDRAT